MKKFTTLEAHLGDRPHSPYAIGETRTVDDAASVKHLIDAKILGDHDPKAEAAFEAAAEKAEKAEGAPLNKAEGKPPSNKAG